MTNEGVVTPERWREIKPILALALERDAAERSRYLDEACGADSRLRAEVESLLAFDSTNENTRERWFSPQDDGQPVCEEGRLIGPYKIVREIGRGGMGAVYLAARADDQYRREAAIKLIRQGMTSDFVFRRFRNERQILAALDHPNIAGLLDGGATEDGSPYLVMEYVAGVPINEYCDQHSLDVEQRLALFQQACAAVHYAHEREVIHRDIKPGNILVTPDGRVKLLDFGIAKLLTPELAAQTLDPTLTAMRLMTPAYASPEQIKGDEITPATDVYSLGVMIYELLTGHKPYRVKGQTSHEITRAVLEEEPLKPSNAITLNVEVQTGDSVTTLTPESVSRTREGTPDRLRRRLRGDLDNIVLMALRKDPRRRYSSVEEFSSDIRRHLEGLPVAARTDSLAYRAAKFIRRKRVAAMVLVLTVIAAVSAALLASTWLSRNSKPAFSGKAPSIAVLPFKTTGVAADEAFLGPGIADAIVSALTNIRGITVRPIRASRRYTSFNQDPVQVGRALRVDAIVEGTITREGENVRLTAQVVNVEDGSLLWELKSADDFANLLAFQNLIPVHVAQAAGLELTDRERMTISKLQTHNIDAYRIYLKGREQCNQRTPDSIRKGLEYFQQAIRIDPDYAAAHSAVAFHHILPGNPLPGIRKMETARAAALRALALDDSLPEAHTALGRAITVLDFDWQAAENEFRRAIELSPNYPDSHFWYSENLSAQGRHEEAIAELELVQRADPGSPRNHFSLVNACYMAKQYDRALELVKQTPLELDSAYYRTYTGLGLVYLQQSRCAEAIATCKKATTLSEGRNIARATLAYAYAKAGERDEAKKILDELSRLYDQPNSPVITIAGVYGALGENDRAFAWLEKAHREREGRMILLNVDPMLEDLHGDPRFGELLQRLRLAR